MIILYKFQQFAILLERVNWVLCFVIPEILIPLPSFEQDEAEVQRNCELLP